MHRTQIILEDWEYQALRARAENENRSISDLVRDILRQTLAQPARGKCHQEEIEGVGENSDSHGRAHDRFLYGGE